MVNVLARVLLIVAAEAGAPTFRTDLPTKVDPVFGDIAGLRRSVDRSLALEADMRGVADGFAKAAHETLAAIVKAGGGGTAKAAGDAKERSCPAGVYKPYGKARAAGVRYLTLGRELDRQMRDIRLADAYGDTVGLTPDYRRKVELARRQHDELVQGFREMQVVFHDQLAAELRYAGCDTSATATDFPPVDATAATAGNAAAAAFPAAAPTPGPAEAMAGIEIDSTTCDEPSRVTVDGKALGTVEGGRRTVVRMAKGPHELCVLPASDKRECGAPGTIRRAYVHDGWVLQVRCGQ